MIDMELSTDNSFDMSIDGDDFNVELIQSEFDIDFAEAVIVQGDRLPNYEGLYEITPRVVEQMLETKDKSMVNDLTVNAIPYVEVSNVGGGFTATIG